MSYFLKYSLGLSKYNLFLVQIFPFTSHGLVFSKLYIVLCTKVFSLFYLSISYHAVLFWLVHDIFYTSVLAAYFCTTFLSPNIDFFFYQTAEEAMTPIESTFSLDVNSTLDWSVCISLYLLDWICVLLFFGFSLSLVLIIVCRDYCDCYSVCVCFQWNKCLCWAK